MLYTQAPIRNDQNYSSQEKLRIVTIVYENRYLREEVWSPDRVIGVSLYVQFEIHITSAAASNDVFLTEHMILK